MKLSSLFFIMLLSSNVSWAQNQNTSSLDAKAVYVELREPVGSKEQDDVSIRVRDLESNRVAQIHLQPSPTDHLSYFGSFIIEFVRGDKKAKTLEFQATGKKLYVFSMAGGSSSQNVQLFTSQADWSKYVQQVKTKTPTTAGPTPEQQQVQIRLDNQQQQQVRQQIEEVMAVKRAEEIAKQESLSASERQSREKKAEVLRKQALDAYKAEKYQDAEKLFGQAADLDPNNDSAYFQYGVTLYKVDNYNKSLAVLSMAEGSGNENERAFYVGLAHMKLHELEQAEKTFVEVRDENDPTFSAPSAFYAGNVQFQQQKYTPARKSFEFVLDNSKDPKMDKAAEAMVEDIDRIENFIAASKERYRFTFNAGAIYDSNVLNLEIPNQKTDVAAYRANYGMTGTAFLYRTMESNLSATLGVNDYYSVDTNFKDNGNLQQADALDESIQLPWLSDFKAGGHTYNYNLTPSYHYILLPLGGSTTRTKAITNALLDAGVSTSASQSWVIRPNYEYGKDDSFIAPGTDEDQTGTHQIFGLSNTWLMDLKGTQSWTLDLSYAKYDTLGRDYRSTKPAAGLTYAFPAFWHSDGSVRVDYSIQDYNEAILPRKDKVTAITLADTKELRKGWTMGLMGMWQSSQSDLATYTYDKFSVQVNFSYLLQILDK